MEEKDIYLLIIRYLSDEAGTEETGFLTDWIKASAKNKTLFEEIRSVWLAEIQPPKEAKEALFRLKQRIRTEEKVKPIRRKRIVYLSVAASVAAMFLLFISLYFRETPTAAPPLLSLETGLKQKKTIQLEDGTRIMLAPESSVRYPERFQDGERVIELQGEAYFEVSKNPHRPFIVHTADLNVKVLGTHFNVSSYKDNNTTRVSLLEGKVAVTIPDQNADEYILKPNEELVFNHADHQVDQHSFDSVSATGWMTNTLVFKNERFSDAAEKISKFYGVKVVMADKATADSRLYGTFRNESLTELMETLKATGNIKYKIDNNKLYISMRK